MGGAPLLLALAAVTVDFGWQPDDKGGIEYIIQIPPGQLEQSGGFTSRIDPRVRGLVSRVVVRVGNGPLPQDFGNLAPNSAPDELAPMLGAIQQVTETQVRQAEDADTVVRGQNGAPNGGFSLPGQMSNTAQPTTQQRGQVAAGNNNVRNGGAAMPSTNSFNNGATTSNQTLQNFRSTSNDASQANATAPPSNDLRNYNDPQSQQPSGNNSTYRDSSWQSNTTQQRGPAPSTSPYDAMTAASNQQTSANQQQIGNNTGIYDRNNPNAGPAYTNDARNNSPLPTFANPNINTTNTGNNSVPGYTSQNQYNANQYAQQQQQQVDTNLQAVNSNQPGYNQQQAAPNGYAGNPNLGPLRNGYGTTNNGQYPNSGQQNDRTGYANNGNQNVGNPLVGYPNQGYQQDLSLPNGYGQPQTGLGSPSYGQGLYNQQTDPRLLIAANAGMFNGSIRDQLAKTESEDKTSAMLLAERERLSTKALELERANDTLAKAKEALLYDNNTLIAESKITKDRLQSMSFFQFFLMVSFLANLYLVVHLSKLYQRYRDLVTTVRASTASAQPV